MGNVGRELTKGDSTLETFRFDNQVRMGISHAILLLYRYLTGIYMLGDLSFVQFIAGFLRGKHRTLDHGRILAVSGNGIGELEKLLCLQWQLDNPEAMSTTPAQMHVMRFLMDASAQGVNEFFNWAQQRVANHPCLKELFASPGLVPYWQQECANWQSSQFNGKVHLYGGSPWDLPAAEVYDAIFLSHAQRLLLEKDAKQLLSLLKPGGLLAAVLPVIFHPLGVHEKMPSRFSDLPVVESAKRMMREDAARLGYELPDGRPIHVNWTLTEGDLIHLVSFSVASSIRNLLVGELLIYSLGATLPDPVRLTLLETALAQVQPGAGTGTESLLILLAEKGD